MKILKIVFIMVPLSMMLYGIMVAAALYSSHCPRCGKAFAAEPLSIVSTNEPVLNGNLTRHRMKLKCPYCGLEFKARSENLEREELAIELPALPARIEQPPIPPLIPSVVGTNLVVLSAPPNYQLRTIHGPELGLHEFLSLYQTNRQNLTLVILEPCPVKQ